MIAKKLNISTFISVSKAYTEGIYADTSTNRKLGRVGMTYAEYNNKKNNSYKLEDIIKEDGKLNFDNLNLITNSILDGTKRINSLNREEEQGRKEGGRRNVEASLITKANKKRNSGQQESRRNDGVLERERELLIDYAKQNSCYFNNEKEFKSLVDSYLSSGVESRVYISKDKKHVVKEINPYIMCEDINEFLDNHLSLYNYIFPESKYELIGFRGKLKDDFRIIIKQPFIQGDIVVNTIPRNENYKSTLLDKRQEIYKDIQERIGKLDPRYSGNGSYVNSNYIIDDVHLKNVMKSTKGTLFYIDVITSLTTNQDYTFGKREYGDNSIIDN